MITDIDKYVEFLTENKLSEHQFLILWLVHTKDEVNIRKYRQSFGQFNIDQVIDLIQTGWIDDFGLIKDNYKTFNIYDFVVSNKFSNRVVIDEEDAYQELCAVYPPFMDVKGVKWPMIKGDPYQNAKDYYKYHKSNKLKHQEAVEITKAYFATHPVTSNIIDYILNRRWLLFKDLVVGGSKDVFKTL